MRRITKAALGGLAGCALVLGGVQAASGGILDKEAFPGWLTDLDEDNLVPLYDPVSHLAYAVEAADVRTVIVDGRIVLRDGVLTTADEREIRSQVRALAMSIGSFRLGANS